MHSAVLQNKKYTKFAAQNTVEVLSLGRLSEAIEKGKPRAATYKGKDSEGNTVDLMVKWPNLTAEQIGKIRRSKAGSYNDTGKIPYTCIVDPHTLERMHVITGGYSAKGLMEEVKNARKVLMKAHGKGMRRDTLAGIKKAASSSAKLVKDGEWDKALATLKKASTKSQSWPESVQEIITSAREDVLTSARSRLDQIKAMDDKEAKRAIRRFMNKIRKTGLYDEAKDFSRSFADAQ